MEIRDMKMTHMEVTHVEITYMEVTQIEVKETVVTIMGMETKVLDSNIVNVLTKTI